MCRQHPLVAQTNHKSTAAGGHLGLLLQDCECVMHTCRAPRQMFGVQEMDYCTEGTFVTSVVYALLLC